MPRSFNPPRPYALAPDGTIWVAERTGENSGRVIHLDDEGNNLGDGFDFARNNFYPVSIGYYGGRVFIGQATDGYGYESVLLSYAVDSADPGHELIYSDIETNERLKGGNNMRVFADGGATFGLGEKVAILDLKGGSKEHPWYPQTYMGAGINKPYNPETTTYAFETCSLGPGGVVLGEPDPRCGREAYLYGPKTPEGFDQVTDVAPVEGGLLVPEYAADRISHVDTADSAGANIDYEFSGSGEAAGALSKPISIVHQPNSLNYFIAEEGNRRVSVFNQFGGYVDTFGYGVSDGADVIEVCGFEIGPCRAGVPSTTDPRSSFTRVDFGPEGNLYAYNATAGQIQVFAVSGAEGPGPGGGGAGGGGGTGGGGTNPGGGGNQSPIFKKEADKVRLRVTPLKVDKGDRVRMTGIVNPAATCRSRKVLFQEKDGRGWDNLGKSKKTNKACEASTKAKVTAKTVFRAVLIDNASDHTLGYSPNVTVKLK